MIKKMADPKKNKKFTLISFQNLSFFCEAQKETFRGMHWSFSSL